MAHLSRTLSLALFLMLFAPSAFAISQNSSAIMEFAVFSVPRGQQFSVEPFPLKDTQAFAVMSNNEVYGIFVSGFPILENRPLTAPDEIENALTAYYTYQNYSPNVTFDDVHAGIASVSDDYQKGEDKCRILTGTDRTECKSFEGCQKACYSVTSFCRNIALGTGRAFVDEIWEFENNSILLDSAYLNESTAYSALLDGITHEEAKAYLNALMGVNRAATTASKSALYDGYSYCFEPDYALPVITNMQLTAQKRYALSEPFFTLTEKAKQVRSRTSKALEAMSAQAKDEAAAQAAKDAALAAQNPPAAPAQNESAPEPLPAAPSQDSGFPIALAGAGILALMIIAGIFLAFFSKKKGKGL